MTYIVVQAVFIVLLLCRLATSYVISDAGGHGRVFDGIGAISGGSATSKLLVNYPQQERNQILDFLFKPLFGASLHILKVEIGGDSQASDGTESSHMHDPWDENYQRGYEWWMLMEAKKRNPKIKLYGLPWSFPGWLGNSHGEPYRNVTATAMYVIKWILGAQKYYNLTIDYIGIWNERAYNIAYVEALKHALIINDLSYVQVIAADGSWAISNDILNNLRFAAAVDIIGCHYPGTLTTNTSLDTKKQLWASEDYSTFNDNVGAGCWARILNQNYVNGYMTSTIAWNLITSYYSSLPKWNRQSLMTAQEPWSGHYVVESPIWITAHTTQFTDMGWTYLKHGRGVDKLVGGGSFVTLASSDHMHFTVVIETMSHNHSTCIRPALPAYTVVRQQATFQLGGHLSSIVKLHVWRSQLAFNHSESTLFQQLAPIKPVNGSFTMELDVDEVYTLTTLSTGHKGSYPQPPPSKPFPLPYNDDFERYAENGEMYNFVGQNGVFEVRQTTDKLHGKVNRQVVLQDPVYWCSSRGPTVNLGGDSKWKELSVTVDMYIQSVNGTSGTFLAVLVGPGGCQVSKYHGIFFTIFPTNSSFVVSADIARRNVLINGTLKDTLELDSWFSTGLVVLQGVVYGFLSHNRVFDITLPTNVTQGFVAYGTTSYGYADFDNLHIEDNPERETALFDSTDQSFSSRL